MTPPLVESSAVAADDLGRRLEACRLGDDCPFEPALRQLRREQDDRIKTESALALQIDGVLGKVQKANETLEELGRHIRELQFQMRMRRVVDLAIMSIGAGLGGFIAKLMVQ